MTDAPEGFTIVAVNLEKRIATLDNGETIPVTKFIDEDGDETDDFQEAFSFVAGPCSLGAYLTDLVEHFDFNEDRSLQ
jgi:hypothetical protein